MYYDIYMDKEPPRVDDVYTTVYAAKQLDSGVWHCLVTEAQYEKHHSTADTFDKLAKKHKDNDTPAHVFGNCVRAPGKRWGPKDKNPIEDDQGEDEE